MIKCISCTKISNSPNFYKVKLISNSPIIELPVSGKDVEGLSNSILFENGSELFINTNDKAIKYIYENDKFVPEDILLEGALFIDNKIIISDDGTVYIE